MMKSSFFILLSCILCLVTAVPPYLPSSITTPPTFYFPLNGTFADISGNGYLATLTGSTSGYGFVTDAIWGTVYQQASRTSGAFGGLLTNVTLPLVYTTSIWVNVLQYDLLTNGSINPQQTPQYLFGSLMTNVNDSTASTMLVADSGSVILLSDQNFGASTFTNVVRATNNVWINIVSTFDASGNFAVYLNGVQIGTQNGQISSGDLAVLQSLPKPQITIGFDSIYSTTPNNVYGKLARALLLPAAITPSQASDLYALQSQVPVTPSSSSSSSSNLGLILGLAIGVPVAVLLLGAVAYMYGGKLTGGSTTGGAPSSASKSQRRNRMRS